LVSGVKGLLNSNKVKVVNGEASFISKDTIEVKTEKGIEKIKSDKFIIAAGSIPAKPPIPGIDSEHCIDSTGALELQEIPKSMVIVGGGVIGVEIATLYSTLGCKITIVEMLDEILPMMDGELTKMIRAKLAMKGVEIYTGAKVMSFKDAASNVEVYVQMSDGTTKVFTGEKALISIGRKPNTQALGLEKAGIKNDKGKILVNEKQETNIPGIYAVGDCTGQIMLAHVASAQGEVAAENALGHISKFDSKTNPSCVYTKPEFASVGLTEEAAKTQGIDYVVGKFSLIFMLSGQVNKGGGLPLVKYTHSPGHEDTPDDFSYFKETGHPGYRADDVLWLFPTVKRYIGETGEITFLDETIPYADKGEDTVYNHLKKAIDFSQNRKGPNGLPLGLHADWNDCLRLGKDGESAF
jgi:dihydrolipoamide dehydrogenase